MTDAINANFAKRALVDTGAMDWRKSPSAGVWRKRLDSLGGEKSRVTALVRYDAGSKFAAHDHPGGEEILVLDGVFSDETGDYPAGTYFLNPPGFRHAPFSREGCTIFVKLHQYGGAGREHLVIDTNAGEWQPTPAAGVTRLPLYERPGYPERMSLVRFAPGATFPRHDHPGGEEAFVIEGGIEDEHGSCAQGTWLRMPPGSAHAPVSPAGCTVYVKVGHLKELVAA